MADQQPTKIVATGLKISIPEARPRPSAKLSLPQPQATSHLQSFHPFRYLPVELRLEIWSHLIPGPRILEICLPRGDVPIPRENPYRYDNSEEGSKKEEEDSGEEDSDKEGDEMDDKENEIGEEVTSDPPPAFFSATPPPILLSINSESRSVALQHYTLAFGSPCNRRPANIYFDFSRDSLYFPEWVFDNGSVGDISPFENTTRASERARVQMIAIDILRWFGGGIKRINNQVGVRQWTGLRKLVWASQKSWNNGACVTCEDRGRPEVLGEVGLQSRPGDKAEGFGVKDTIKSLEENKSDMERLLGGKWNVPEVETMSLMRDGVRAVWPKVDSSWFGSGYGSESEDEAEEAA